MNTDNGKIVNPEPLRNRPHFVATNWQVKETRSTHKKYCTECGSLLRNGNCWQGCEQSVAENK